jgi:hypothetical protein
MTASPRGGYPPGGRDAAEQAVSGPGAAVCGLRPFASERDPFHGAHLFVEAGNRIVELHWHASTLTVRTPNGCVRLTPARARELGEELRRMADAVEREVLT